MRRGWIALAAVVVAAGATLLALGLASCGNTAPHYVLDSGSVGSCNSRVDPPKNGVAATLTEHCNISATIRNTGGDVDSSQHNAPTVWLSAATTDPPLRAFCAFQHDVNIPAGKTETTSCDASVSLDGNRYHVDETQPPRLEVIQ